MNKHSPCPHEPQPSEQGQVTHTTSVQGREAQDRERYERAAQGVPRQDGGRIAHQGQGDSI